MQNTKFSISIRLSRAPPRGAVLTTRQYNAIQLNENPRAITSYNTKRAGFSIWEFFIVCPPNIITFYRQLINKTQSVTIAFRK